MSPLPGLSRVQTALGTVTERLGKRLALGLLAAGVVLLAFAGLAGEVREGETEHFDESIRFAVHGLSSPPITAIVIAATELGSPAGPLPGPATPPFLFPPPRRLRSPIPLLASVVGPTPLT